MFFSGCSGILRKTHGASPTPRCLHSLTFGRHDCFGRLCNLGLPKTLHFFLQRHKAAKSYTFCDSLPVSCFASENSCFRNSHEQKLQNSALPNSGIVCRFSPWNVFPPMEPAFFFGALAQGFW